MTQKLTPETIAELAERLDGRVRQDEILAPYTTFRIGGETNRTGGKTTVAVTYKSPLYIPGVNRFLDPDGAWPYEMDITSVAAIPSEVPVTADRTLGIPYRSK